METHVAPLVKDLDNIFTLDRAIAHDHKADRRNPGHAHTLISHDPYTSRLFTLEEGKNRRDESLFVPTKLLESIRERACWRKLAKILGDCGQAIHKFIAWSAGL